MFGLIIQLEADDMRFIFDFFHQSADDFFCVGQIDGMRNIHVLAVPINLLASMVQSQEVICFFCKPGWDCIGWRSDDDRNMMLSGSIQHAMEMGKIILSFLWLPGTPGRFSDPDHIHSGFFHHCHVCFNAVIWHIFIVICSPIIKFVSFHKYPLLIFANNRLFISKFKHFTEIV